MSLPGSLRMYTRLSWPPDTPKTIQRRSIRNGLGYGSSTATGGARPTSSTSWRWISGYRLGVWFDEVRFDVIGLVGAEGHLINVSRHGENRWLPTVIQAVRGTCARHGDGKCGDPERMAWVEQTSGPWTSLSGARPWRTPQRT